MGTTQYKMAPFWVSFCVFGSSPTHVDLRFPSRELVDQVENCVLPEKQP